MLSLIVLDIIYKDIVVRRYKIYFFSFSLYARMLKAKSSSTL